MKISNNYAMHKVQNKNITVFKKLVLEIASTLLQHKNSKYIKVKPPEQRVFVKTTLKHLHRRAILGYLCQVIIQPTTKRLHLGIRQLAVGSRPAVFTGHPSTPTGHPSTQAWQRPLVMDQNFWSQYHQAFSLALCYYHIFYKLVDLCFVFMLLLSHFIPSLTWIIGC